MKGKSGTVAKVSKRWEVWAMAVMIAIVVVRAVVTEKIISKTLYDFDEARYGEIAKNILKTGNWIIPMAGGPSETKEIVVTRLEDGTPLNPYFWKPPLQPMIMAVGFKIWGINEGAVRWWSLVFGIGGLVMTVLIGKEMGLGIWKLAAAGLLAASGDFSFLSAQGVAETQLWFLLLLTLWLAIKGGRMAGWSGVAFGAAVLTKSFGTMWALGLVLLIWAGRRNVKEIGWWLAGAGIVALPWHGFMMLKFGGEFWNGYVVNNVWGRISGEQQNVAPVYWYVKYGLEHWGAVIAGGVMIMRGWKIFLVNKKWWWLVGWLGLVLVPYSLSSSKVWWYVWPMWTAVSILVAWGAKNMGKWGIIILMIIIGIQFGESLKEARRRKDYNLGIKLTAMAYNQKVRELAVVGMPYEAPLFYFDSGQIDWKVDEETKYIVTNIDSLNKINEEKWELVEQKEKTYLYKKK